MPLADSKPTPARPARFWRSAQAGLWLVLLCLSVYLPGLWSIPPVDRDECRFAQASRQMFEAAALPPDKLDLRTDPSGKPIGLHAGGWVIPMVQDRARLNKPPLIYWLQVASAATFTGGDPTRDAIWMYRVPSVLCAIITVLATWRLGLRLFDPRAAWLGAALLAICPMVIWDAHQARADQLLLACTTVSMWCLWVCVSTTFSLLTPEAGSKGASPADPGRSPLATADAGPLNPDLRSKTHSGPASHRSFLWPILLWLAVGLGILAKGFITPMVVLLTIAALCWWTRSWRPLRATRPWLAVPIIAVVVLPWVYLISERFGLAAYAKLVWQETFVRAAAGSTEGHFAPPGTHLVLLAALFWPGCLLTAVAFVRTCRRAWGVPSNQQPRGVWATIVIATLACFRVPARGRGAEVFLLAWIVPAWIVFELSLAKLPHYTLPLYPAVALLTARVVLARWVQRPIRALEPGLIIWMIVPLALLVALFVMATWGERRMWNPEGTPMIGVAAAASLAIPTLLLAHLCYRRGQIRNGHALAIGAGVWLLAFALQFTIPAIVPGHQTSRIMRDVAWIDPTSTRPIAGLYKEDSLVFATRGRLVRLDSKEALKTWLGDNPKGLAIVKLTDQLPTIDPSRSLMPNLRAGLGILTPEGFKPE